MEPYEHLVAEALAAPFEGWDFSWLRDRTTGEDLSWSYPDLARAAIADAARLLDIDTGGGEQLAGLRPLPAYTVALEGWAPNLAVARRRLEPLGVEVRQTTDDGRLPVADGEFDLVLNRHGWLDAADTWRALAPGGVFLTQQVGSRNGAEINAALGAPPSIDLDAETCDLAVAALRAQGFRVDEAREEMPAYVFGDIGAVVYQLRAVPWTIDDFDVRTYDVALRRLDARIRETGEFATHDHRYLIRATKPRAGDSVD
ncbi:methyltransferase domain-containing protein [Actinopolymorpha sp. B17G11]|uniref:methyltransferase domain-containing protein n=1 Tax=Actinopolymorpha sp. B17G11 TaxID=3160861 RepID=UPI0032E40B43